MLSTNIRNRRVPEFGEYFPVVQYPQTSSFHPDLNIVIGFMLEQFLSS